MLRPSSVRRRRRAREEAKAEEEAKEEAKGVAMLAKAKATTHSNMQMMISHPNATMLAMMNKQRIAKLKMISSLKTAKEKIP